MQRIRFFLPLLLICGVAATQSPSTEPAAVKKASAMFSADAMKAHDRFLASDLLEGRGHILARIVGRRKC